MFSHVTKTIGGPHFGLPTVPAQHRPHLPAHQIIRTIWPFVRKGFALPPPTEQIAEAEPPLSETHWPIVASVVANQLIRETKDVLNPKLGAALVMEAAIAASKVDPKTVPVKQAA